MSDDMATMPIRELIDAMREKAKGLDASQIAITMVLNVLANRLEQQADTIDDLINPGWDDFIELMRIWLQHYPEDIFTGESGDPGAKFIVAVRKAYEDLSQAGGGYVLTPVGTRPRKPEPD